MVFFYLISCSFINYADSLDSAENQKRDTQHNYDTAVTKIVSVPESTWLRRNEGSIFSGAIASLIAILSVHLTARSAKKTQKRQEKEIYCGYLFAIKTELLNQAEIIPKLIESLKYISKVSVEAKEFMVSKAPRSLNSELLKVLRNKIIDTEIFNTHVLLRLITYINICETINSDMKFDFMQEFVKNLQKNSPGGKNDFGFSILGYFNILIDEADNLNSSITDIIALIDADLAFNGKPKKKESTAS